MAEVAYYFFWLFLDGAKNRANGASQLNFIIGSGAIIKLLFQIIIKEFIRIEVRSVRGQKYQRRCLIRSATPPESGGKSLVWGFVAEALSRSSIDLCGDAVKI